LPKITFSKYKYDDDIELKTIIFKKIDNNNNQILLLQNENKNLKLQLKTTQTK